MSDEAFYWAIGSAAFMRILVFIWPDESTGSMLVGLCWMACMVYVKLRMTKLEKHHQEGGDAQG